MTDARDPRAKAFADLVAAAVARVVDRKSVELREGAPEGWDIVRVTADPAGTLLDLQAADGRFGQVRLSATWVRGELM